jgi:hypothetical protein
LARLPSPEDEPLGETKKSVAAAGREMQSRIAASRRTGKDR